MTLSIRYRGAGRYVLAHAGNEVGTIQGRSLRIGGFDTEADAAEARHAGFVALLRWIALRSDGSRPREEAAGIEETARGASASGAVATTGAEEGSVIARLLRLADDEQSHPARGAYAVEFRLPAGLFAAVALHAAQTIHAAIRAARDGRAPVAAPAENGAATAEAGVAAAR